MSKKISLYGIVCATGILITLLTIAGFFGKFYWIIDLTSHFRMQYVLGLSACTIVCVILKKKIGAVILAVPILINLSVLLPYIAPVKTQIDSMEGNGYVVFKVRKVIKQDLRLKNLITM